MDIDSLIIKYPKIFSSEEFLGFECGDGWAEIIDNFCRITQQRIDRGDCIQVIAEQVKEKFGGIRFYYSGGDDFVYKLYCILEDLSFKTCEICGAEGKLRHGGWLKTHCDNCTRT